MSVEAGVGWLQGIVAEDQIRSLLRQHHDRRINVSVGDVRHDGGVDDPYAERLNEDGAYAWNLWRPYKCCQPAGAALIAVIEWGP